MSANMVHVNVTLRRNDTGAEVSDQLPVMREDDGADRQPRRAPASGRPAAVLRLVQAWRCRMTFWTIVGAVLVALLIWSVVAAVFRLLFEVGG